MPDKTCECACDSCDHTLWKALGWATVALGVAMLGLYAGREMRQRYKFKRRTPYDYYSHAGEGTTAEYGVGI